MLVRIFLIFFLANSFSIAQSKDFGLLERSNSWSGDTLNTRKVTNIEWKRLVLVTSGVIVANVGVYQPFKDVWWQEERTGFHLYRGYRRTIGYWDFGWHDSLFGHMDKLGHYYSSKLIAELFTDLSYWIGFNYNSSRVIGPIVSFILMSEIEIYDSFFRDWGFSLADFTANSLGAFSPLLNNKLMFFNRFKLKFSYFPSGYYQKETEYINDYSGMTFWLSYSINQDLPHKIEQYWPDFLNIAIGYSVDQPFRGNVELYFAPDINWAKVYQGKNKPLNYFFKILNYLHFPCVTWKFSPRYKFYPIYF